MCGGVCRGAVVAKREWHCRWHERSKQALACAQRTPAHDVRGERHIRGRVRWQRQGRAAQVVVQGAGLVQQPHALQRARGLGLALACTHGSQCRRTWLCLAHTSGTVPTSHALWQACSPAAAPSPPAPATFAGNAAWHQQHRAVGGHDERGGEPRGPVAAHHVPGAQLHGPARRGTRGGEVCVREGGEGEGGWARRCSTATATAHLPLPGRRAQNRSSTSPAHAALQHAPVDGTMYAPPTSCGAVRCTGRADPGECIQSAHM